jgi:raffinose/stachyose/melibiose transport system substrate-binding protein
VVFHLDVAIGLAAASQHQEEAKAFLTWMTTPAFAMLLAEEIPGFFPMHRLASAGDLGSASDEGLSLTNPHVVAFLALNEDHETDIRFAWELLRDDTPSGYALMQDGALAVLRGEQTPQEAADALQAGLAQWFSPAQNCE